MFYTVKITEYQHFVCGERYFLYSTKEMDYYFYYRVGSVPGLHKYKISARRMWRTQSIPEKRAYYEYEQQFKEVGLVPKRRRTPSALIDSYDDVPCNRYRGSWKHSTKKRRQWGGTVELIYCG